MECLEEQCEENRQIRHTHLAIFIQKIAVKYHTYNSRLTLFPGQEFVSYCLLITSSCFLATKEINHDNLLKKHSLVEAIKEPFKVQKKARRLHGPPFPSRSEAFQTITLCFCATRVILVTLILTLLKPECFQRMY